MQAEDKLGLSGLCGLPSLYLRMELMHIASSCFLGSVLAW